MNTKRFARFSASLLAASLLVLPLAAEIKIKVKTPGTLKYELSKINSLDSGMTLRISGTLDNADIRALRNMCGADSDYNSFATPVHTLDLRNVDFIPSEGHFITLRGKPVGITSARSIPPLMLYGCCISEIVLPERLDTIHAWSLANTSLRKIYVTDGTVVMPRAFANDTLMEEMRLPTADCLYDFSYENLRSLRRVETGGFIYATGSSFYGLQNLEEAVFNGAMGHIDATPFIRNPHLRSIRFNGPLYSTGTVLASGCPKLEKVEFNAPVGTFAFMDLREAENGCDQYTFNAPLFRSFTEGVPASEPEELARFKGRDEFIRKGAEIARTALQRSYKNEDMAWVPMNLIATLEKVATPEELAAYLPDKDSIEAEAKKFDFNKTKIEILRESAPYAANGETIEWTYDAPQDSLLTLFREKFNLDSIAGNGSDEQRVRNLTYWIHERIRHNGNRPDRPETPYDLDKIIQYGAEQDSLGANCRMMAIALSQALLAEGIPARYLTCQSKRYDTDTDCHVICCAWLADQKKWMWADPTFAAFVTDENGTPLDPGEVRMRLIDGGELILNPDANWNHEELQTKEDYLENYMAKNLYIISSPLRNGIRPEGPESKANPQISLVPEGFDFKWGDGITHWPETFWAAPEAASAK